MHALRKPHRSDGISMKIAFLDEDLSPRTGSRRFTCEITRELEKMGHEVVLLTMRLDRSSCFRAFLSLPVNVLSKKKIAAQQSLGRFTNSYRHVRENLFVKTLNDLVYRLTKANLAMNMGKRIDNMNCDVAMVHYHGEHWLMPYFYHLRKPKAVVYLNVTAPLRGRAALPFQRLPLHSQFVDKALRLPPVGTWEQTSLKKIRMFLGPSNYLLGNAEKQGMIGETRAETIPLGVNHSEFFPTGEEEPFALYVGRIHPHKSLELAVMAVKGTNACKSLVIAGDVPEGYNWYVSKLVKLAERMKIAEKIKIITSPSDAETVRLLQRCSVFLFPSTIDTFGLVVLEAMACGKPVIACDRGGVPEAVGNAGFLLEPDVRQWQKTVELVFSDPEIRRQKQEMCLERSKSFTWTKTAEKLLSSFDNILSAND
jgi:glycosyltransferase involved in cell wall biosynthesis